MNFSRRSLLGSVAALAASLPFVGKRAAAHPPLDKPWPLDVRAGLQNNRDEAMRTSVWKDGQRLHACCAAAPETGHALQYRQEPSTAFHLDGYRLVRDRERNEFIIDVVSGCEFREAPPVEMRYKYGAPTNRYPQRD